MKSPAPISSPEEYLDLVGKFNRKGSLSNNYLQSSFPKLIEDKELFKIEGENNLFILQKKDGFYRLYYTINDTAEILRLPDGPLTTEIIFRKSARVSGVETDYLKKLGLKEHLIRDQYSGIYNKLHKPSPLHSGIRIYKTSELEDASWAFGLFNEVFDRLTGDYVSPEDYSEIMEKGDLILAEKDGILAGALHQTIISNVAWISHVAVGKEARGQQIGRLLVDYFVENNRVSDKSRYMLWVQNQNAPAVNMYLKKGFVPTGKSSLSMIKL